ncbi:hypothetical protein EVAR_83565_1 [Eumeta japonica]|uniref:Uncharacterized protein n=1 Tax=Eumeta variegata TaxID=151549 RepID=A0A4C1UPP8_EUMVA|nr:hypothetical protein EVAR_83565_1 [Eumeta japonica]
MSRKCWRSFNKRSLNLEVMEVFERNISPLEEDFSKTKTRESTAEEPVSNLSSSISSCLDCGDDPGLWPASMTNDLVNILQNDAKPTINTQICINLLNKLIDKFTEYRTDEHFERVLEEATNVARDLNVETDFPPIDTVRPRRKPTQFQYEQSDGVLLDPKTKYKHEYWPVRLVQYQALTVYRREVTVSAVGFRPIILSFIRYSNIQEPASWMGIGVQATAVVTPLELQVSMGSDDDLFYDSSHVRLPFYNGIKNIMRALFAPTDASRGAIMLLSSSCTKSDALLSSHAHQLFNEQFIAGNII